MASTRRVRTLLVLVVLAVVAAPALAACGGEGADVGAAARAAGTSYDAPEFAERMARPGTVLLDVRTPEEFAAGHIDGARNLPIGGPDFEERVAALDPGSTYAVYCRTDVRSGRALEALAERGLTDVFDLEGGMDAWQEYGGAVVTG